MFSGSFVGEKKEKMKEKTPPKVAIIAHFELKINTFSFDV